MESENTPTLYMRALPFIESKEDEVTPSPRITLDDVLDWFNTVPEITVANVLYEEGHVMTIMFNMSIHGGACVYACSINHQGYMTVDSTRTSASFSGVQMSYNDIYDRVYEVWYEENAPIGA